MQNRQPITVFHLRTFPVTSGTAENVTCRFGADPERQIYVAFAYSPQPQHSSPETARQKHNWWLHQLPRNLSPSNAR